MIAKPKSRVNWKKRFWKVFSEYVRRRDGGKCCTCSTVKTWKEMDAGHYVPAGQSNPAIYFDERNVNSQCTSCNRFKHGNLSQYAIFLTRKYGDGILEELERLKREQHKWSEWTYKIKIDEYKKKLERYGNH